MRTVYVVGFAPSKDSANGVGGFVFSFAKEEAVARLVELTEDGGTDATYFEISTPDGTSAPQVQEWLDGGAGDLFYDPPTPPAFPTPAREVGDSAQYVLLAGNLSEGFEAYGPFPSFSDAADYFDRAEFTAPKYDSWIMTMTTQPASRPAPISDQEGLARANILEIAQRVLTQNEDDDNYGNDDEHYDALVLADYVLRMVPR